MSNWNGKLKCIKGWETWSKNKLTEGKIYEVKNGRYEYDDGTFSAIYDNFEDFSCGNDILKNHLIEVPEEEDLTYLLKTGRVAETRDGAKYLIIRDVDTQFYGHQEWGLINMDGFLTSQDYDINLKEINSDSDSFFDIMEIYQENSIDECQLSGNFMDIESKNYLVWERKEKEKEYYLKDNFLSGHNCYLNLGLGHLDEHFFLSSGVKESDYCKTKFTDKEIEELKIPIERFKKIEVEEGI